MFKFDGPEGPGWVQTGKMMEGSLMPLTVVFDAFLFLRISFAYFTEGGKGSDEFIHYAM